MNGILLWAIGVGVVAIASFLAGYQLCQNRTIAKLRRGLKEEYVETLENFADFVDPNKPNPDERDSGSSSVG